MLVLVSTLTLALLRATRASQRHPNELSLPTLPGEDDAAQPTRDSKRSPGAPYLQGSHHQNLCSSWPEPGNPLRSKVTIRGGGQDSGLVASHTHHKLVLASGNPWAGVTHEMCSVLGHKPRSSGKDSTLV